MSKAFLLSVLLLFAGFITLAQDNTIQDENVEKRSVSGFHTIKVENGIDLYLSQGATDAVAVSAAKPEYRDRIKTTVENGVLRIWFDNSNFHFNWRSRQARAYVSAKMLRELSASGGSDVYIQEGGLKAGNFKMSLSGGSDFQGSIQCENLEIDASGASDTRISGKVVNLKLSASGGSDFNGFDLIAENAFISASGGSDAEISVTRELGVEASGGSDVDYRGGAVIKYRSTSGGSSVSKKD